MTKLSNPQRFLQWKNCNNIHELGGYPALNGKTTRWQALIRCDNTAQLTPGGVQAAVDYGVRTVIDLRFPDELKISPSAFTTPATNLNGSTPAYLNIPLDQDQDLKWPYPGGPAEAMCDLYLRMLEGNRTFIAHSLTAIANANPGAVLFHCYAGKDRTGVVSAMLLSLLGVDEDVIISDYAFSDDLLEIARRRDMADPALTPEQLSSMTVMYSALPDSMRLTLSSLKEKYGGVEDYIRSTPAKPDLVQKLQERFLE
jgi:protein-tyrosine phosphatase